MLSVSLSDDQACVYIILGILLGVFMRACSGHGPPNLLCACQFELISLCLVPNIYGLDPLKRMLEMSFSVIN